MKIIDSYLCQCLTLLENNTRLRNKHCIDSNKFNLQAVLWLEDAKMLSPDEVWVLHYSWFSYNLYSCKNCVYPSLVCRRTFESGVWQKKFADSLLNVPEFLGREAMVINRTVFIGGPTMVGVRRKFSSFRSPDTWKMLCSDQLLHVKYKIWELFN